MRSLHFIQSKLSFALSVNAQACFLFLLYQPTNILIKDRNTNLLFIFETPSTLLQVVDHLLLVSSSHESSLNLDGPEITDIEYSSCISVFTHIHQPKTLFQLFQYKLDSQSSLQAKTFLDFYDSTRSNGPKQSYPSVSSKNFRGGTQQSTSPLHGSSHCWNLRAL